MKIIDRNYYENLITGLLGKGEAIVLTGHRRAGKSTILESLSKKFVSTGNVIFLDMENPDNSSIKNYIDLHEFTKEKLFDDKKNYLFIDEVQEIDNFEKTLRFLAKQDNVDVIITGSNAFILSGEIATLFAGRCSELHIYSLDYQEFLHFHDIQDSDTALLSYLKWGGLPFMHNIPLDDTRSRIDYLGGIYNTIFIKDIVKRHNIRNVALIDNLARFIADNCGKLFSANSISNYLKSNNIKVAANTINEYISYLCEAYLIDKVERYDIKGKKVFEQQEKYYFEDIGIRNYLCNDKRNTDIEKIMENIVYLRLKELGYDVFVGQLNGKEIDFVAKLGDDIRYYQVTYSISSVETYEREYGNLKLIDDNYPKYVITMDKSATFVNDSGIKTVLLHDFLMEQSNINTL